MTAIAFVIGLCLGAVVGAYLAWERFLRHERPRIELRITPELIHQIDMHLVSSWLHAHGLTWMPQGPDFRPKVKQ